LLFKHGALPNYSFICIHDRDSRFRFAADRLRRNFLVPRCRAAKAVEAAADQADPANDIIG
jgi:hypothetical protein